MSSKIICICGNIVYKNLFSGTHANLIISDTKLDQIDDSWPTSRTMDHIITNGQIMVQCTKCGRIMIESKDDGTISSYKLESGHAP